MYSHAIGHRDLHDVRVLCASLRVITLLATLGRVKRDTVVIVAGGVGAVRGAVRAGVFVATIAAIVGYVFRCQTGSHDPREYPDDSWLTVRYGDGRLETVLPLYGLELPCDVRDVRYRESQSFVGSVGTLDLRLVTSSSCLTEFLL